MAATGCGYWREAAWLGVDGRITGLLSFFCLSGMMLRSKLPAALIIFCAGVPLGIIKMLQEDLRPRVGSFSFPLLLPSQEEWLNGFVEGALPQIPLTTLNSVVSVCALSTQLF